MAIPAILRALNGHAINPQLNQIKQTMQMVRSAGNPNAMMQSLLSRNPQYAQAMKLVQESGGDAQAAFYKLADKVGVDPNEILSALK